jgi:hypothetical protein
MFAQSYNPHSVTDPFYLNLVKPDERFRKRQTAQRRRHVGTKRQEKESHKMHSVLRKQDEDEDELRQCRLDILLRYMNKCQSEHQVDYGGDDEMKDDDWHSDPGRCVPREVNIILSPGAVSPGTPSTQAQGQITEPCEDSNCFTCDAIPHLIGVEDVDEEDEEDISLL